MNTVIIFVIDQVRGQDGWVLANFLIPAYLWTKTESRSMKIKKKAHTPQLSCQVDKGFLLWPEDFLAGHNG